VVPSLATGWSHHRGRNLLTVVPSSWQATIKSFPSAERGSLWDNLHVGVQVSPERTVIESEVVQDYLAKYFGETRVSIYWGSCTRFLVDLASRTRPKNG
jgi:hypothetical protein